MFTTSEVLVLVLVLVPVSGFPAADTVQMWYASVCPTYRHSFVSIIRFTEKDIMKKILHYSNDKKDKILRKKHSEKLKVYVKK